MNTGLPTTSNLTWGPLVETLRKEAEQLGVLEEVSVIFDEFGIDDLTSLRHSLVHGALDVSQPPAIAIARHYKKVTGKRPQVLLGSRQQVDIHFNEMAQMNEALRCLLPPKRI